MDDVLALNPYLSPPDSASAASHDVKSEVCDDSSAGLVFPVTKTEIKEEEVCVQDDLMWSLRNGAVLMEDTVCLQDNKMVVKNEENLQESPILVPEEDDLEKTEVGLLESGDTLIEVLRDLQNTCPICERKFRLPSRLRRHIMNHSSERKFKCTICDARFKTLSTLQSHVLTHSMDKPFKCTMCPSTQCTKSALRKHVERKHSTIVKRFLCDICDLRFESKSKLERHIERHMGKNVLCTVCGKLFYTEKDLRIHVAKIHELKSKIVPPKLFHCLHCNRGYTYKLHLANHILSVHLNVKEYQCFVCDKRFAMKVQVEKHMEIHSSKKHFCKCGRSFSTKQSLERHCRTHINYRPFTCAMCGLTFTQKSSVARHITTNMEKEHIKRTGTCKPITGGRGGYYAFDDSC